MSKRSCHRRHHPLTVGPTITTLILVCAALAAVIPEAGADREEGESSASELKGLKKRIAVADFEDKSDRSVWYWTGPNPGDGMSDMLTTALVKSGKFAVIEREQLHIVLAEQDLGTAGVVTPETAAQIGKVLGVSAIVYGSVSEFGYKKESTGGSISSLPVGGGLSKAEARVGCDVRIVDTSTAEILAAESYSESESKRGLKIGTDEFSFEHSAKFDQTLVGKATRKVIDKIVEKLIDTTEDSPWVGRVVKADSEDKVYLNAGADAGVTPGMTFTIYRQGEELIDPATGLSLGAEEEMIATLEVVSVKEKYSIARTVSGSGATAGDVVRDR
jgi:curli biogenesis system outer membrane secretion channel CsgG